MNSRIDPSRKKLPLAMECAALFLGVPAAYVAGWIPMHVLLLLLLMAAGCGLALRQRHRVRIDELLRTQPPRAEWRRVFGIYAITAPCLLVLLWLARPDALFSLLRDQPKIWLLVTMAYPLVSVFPQELIYRAFFFERYRPLFGQGSGMIAMSAAAFSFAHIVFHNVPAIVLTLAGGWLFGRTYRRTKSLRLVVVEHALYGWAIFTLGYGGFFFQGTLRLFR